MSQLAPGSQPGPA